MGNWTAEPVTAQGPRKGEPSLLLCGRDFGPQPANSVRGSSRRIMTMRFRPANIRVINRRVCSWAVIGPAVHNQRSKLTSGNVFAPEPPSNVSPLPERCSQSRVRFAAPNTGAPSTTPRRSGRMVIATGGSGGNTKRSAKNKTRQPTRRGLDRVAPYQNTSVHIVCGMYARDG